MTSFWAMILCERVCVCVSCSVRCVVHFVLCLLPTTLLNPSRSYLTGLSFSIHPPSGHASAFFFLLVVRTFSPDGFTLRKGGAKPLPCLWVQFRNFRLVAIHEETLLSSIYPYCGSLSHGA